MSTSDTSAKQLTPLDPDVRLMLALRDGDDGAFAELIERYQNRVIAVLFHVVGNIEEAEDLAQEVFLRVYRARRGYKPTAKFSTWVFTITNNLALNALRSKRRRQTVPIDARESGPLGARPAEQLLEEPGRQAPEQIERNEIAQLVRDAVNKLNERQRMAVVLNKFEDLGYAEIASVMGMTTKAVKSLLSRARMNLREMLEPYLDVH